MKIFKTLLLYTILLLCKSNILAQWPDREMAGNLEQMPFLHGVASGDPLTDAVIIWTRVTPKDFNQNSLNVSWELASDLDMKNIVKQGQTQALAENDFTVKVDVTGLQEDSYYYYRFTVDNDKSIIGRTKTCAALSENHARVALLTCSDYRVGYFNVYSNLAQRNDLDLIVHLGDYLYEGGGGPEDRKHSPDSEIWQLQDYRSRYSLYRLDTALQRLHQVHPWMTIWDDHDIVVDAARDTSLRHREEFGEYSKRKFAAIKAAREWLPIRDPQSNNFYKNWRKTSLGNLLDVYMIDARLYDRDLFPTSTQDTLYGSETAKLLGPEQLDWLMDNLKQSKAKWKLIANGLMIAQFRALTIPLILENWDGYPVERNKFYKNLSDHNIDNVVFGTGDFHVSFANDLSPEPYNPLNYNPITGQGSLGVELIVPSVTGGNLAEGDSPIALPTIIEQLKPLQNQLTTIGLERAIQAGNPHTKYVKLDKHGYVLLDFKEDKAQAEFWYVNSISENGLSTAYLGQLFNLVSGSNKLSSPCVLGEYLNNYSLLPGCTVSAEKTGIPTLPPSIEQTNSIDNNAIALAQLYPNPATDYLVVQVIAQAAQEFEIEILGANGERLEMAKLNSGQIGVPFYLPIHKLSAGAYLLKIKQGENYATYKWLKR